MIGILVQLALSWLIVWFVEKNNLKVLGLFPTKQRLTGFLLFFTVTAACSASGFFLRMYFGKEQWQLNPDISAGLVLKSIWWNIASVLFEELIFRGVLLYLLIKRLGALKGIVLSAIAFGIYHWFSHEVFGDAKQMAITFALTGIMGLVYAYGYAKTFSLYVPFAIHLGWNLVQSFVFSSSIIGNQLLVPVMPQPQVTISRAVYLCIIWMPIVSAWIINYLLLKKHKQAPLPSA